MTIIFHGHVERIESGATPGGTRLTIQPEARRDLAPLTLEAWKGEADAYKPGGGVEVRIVPVAADTNFITPWEAAYTEIAAVVGIKGEMWNVGNVVREVRRMRERLDALRDALTL